MLEASQLKFEVTKVVYAPSMQCFPRSCQINTCVPLRPLCLPNARRCRSQTSPALWASSFRYAELTSVSEPHGGEPAFRLPLRVDVMSLSSRGYQPFVRVLYSSRGLMSSFWRHMGHRPLVVSTLSEACKHPAQNMCPVESQHSFRCKVRFEDLPQWVTVRVETSSMHMTH